MLVEHLPKTAPWSLVSSAVFWSREVILEAWRAGILSAHRSYLPDSVSRMSTWHFVRFLGRKDFALAWPRVRESLAPDHRGRARLDVAWSLAATGKLNVPPESALAAFPGRSREVFDAVVDHQGASIYEVAKLTGVSYRRAHAHVKALAAKGLLKCRLDESGPRKKLRLYTLRGSSG